MPNGDISPEELEQFRKWKGNKDARKVKSTARRKAMSDLKSNHAPEYAKLVKTYGG